MRFVVLCMVMRSSGDLFGSHAPSAAKADDDVFHIATLNPMMVPLVAPAKMTAVMNGVTFDTGE